jgi:hypothetical protein
MLTIWGTCRPFLREPHVTAQRNSIQSWRLLSDDVILFGKECGVAEIAKELDCQHVPGVELNKWGTPVLGGLFAQARELAKHDLICSACCDMILFDDIVRAAEVVSSRLERFLVVGRKFHLGFNTGVDFCEGWEERLRKSAKRRGELHKLTGGSDYFVYPRGLFAGFDFPRIVRGRYRDDIYIITTALEKRIPVVDATHVVMAIHQPHRKQRRAGDEEVMRNVRLTRDLRKKCVKDATWMITEDWAIKKK